MLLSGLWSVLARYPQGQATKLLPLEFFGVETNILDSDGCLLLAHSPILGGATGGFGGIYALDSKDTGNAVAVGTVGQLLIEPQGSGVRSCGRERPDMSKAIVV